MSVQVTAERDGTVISVYVAPRARRAGIVGEREGALCVRLAPPPVEGAANRALEELLAARLGVPRSAVHVVAGASSRQKRVRIAGMTPERVLARLPAS